MSDDDSRVATFPGPTPPPQQLRRNGNGGGNDRLRAVEERLTRIETELPHLATKVDIEKLRVWILSGVIGGIALALGATFIFLRLFGQ